MNIAIILAGGIGSRASEPVPKQFIIVNDKPLVVHTMEKFEKSSYIDKLCVVTMPMWKATVWEYAKFYNISKLEFVVDGGSNGIQSAYNGIKAFEHILTDADIVAIHDGVRPFVTQEIIEDNIKMAKEKNVALSSVPCVETLVYCEDDLSSKKIIARDNLYRVQTPQAFQYKILKEIMHKSADGERIKLPSLFALYMEQGGEIHCSFGSEKNISTRCDVHETVFRVKKLCANNTPEML